MMEINRLMNEERKKAEEKTSNALKTIFAMEDLVFTQDGKFAQLMKTIETEDQLMLYEPSPRESKFNLRWKSFSFEAVSF